jgi:hypothetical protein
MHYTDFPEYAVADKDFLKDHSTIHGEKIFDQGKVMRPGVPLRL